MRSVSQPRFDRVSTLLADDARRPTSLLRVLALVCSLGLVASYTVVLREITRFVGGTDALLTLVVLALGIGLAAAPLVRERVAIGLGLFGAIVAFLTYFSAAGLDPAMVVSAFDELVSDVFTLAGGLELIRVVEARAMALAYAPAPAFLTWYLALRRRYGLAVVPAGLALGFLVLTGDAWNSVALVGTAAGAGVVAFGELERREAGFASLDVLVVVAVAMIFCSLFVPLVPGGTDDGGLVTGTGSGTLEGSTAGSPDRSSITGSVALSPEVRFTVQSDEPSYWRTGVYDRYAGDEWIRTGESTPYDGPRDPPPGDTDRLVQEVTIKSPLQLMPVAAAPISVDGTMTKYTEVSEDGQFYPSITLQEGDQFTVVSAVLDPSSEQLQAAGTEYPDEIEQRYLQQPDDRSDAFTARTEEIVAGAETAYEKALLIEEHLSESKSYSLDVDKPDGDVAEAFLLEMDEGYCVYYATTMVQMLRSEGIPARYATGYTEGERVDGNTWVVRGTDAHAWPEVYFPEIGWVAFEPTPGGPRDAVHQERIEQARENGNPNVDIEETEPDPTSPTDDPNNSTPENSPSENSTSDNETVPTDPNNESPLGNEGGPDLPADNGVTIPTPVGDGITVPIPSLEQVVLAALFGLGLVAASYRTGVGRAVARTIRLYWQRPSGDPTRDAELTYRRLEVFLARQYRPRRPTESPRAYIESLSSGTDLDDRVYDVFYTRERATYGGAVEASEATAAIDAMDSLVATYRPILGPRE